MLKIALLGDVHLKQSNLYKEFEANRFKLLCNTISAKEYDVVIFIGDLLDKARPSLEEILLLSEGLSSIQARKIVLDGNHEAVSKSTSTYDYINVPNLEYMSFDKLTLEGVSIFLMGYKRLKDYLLVPKSDILLSHFRSNFGFIKEEVDTEAISKKASTVILGDIHKRHNPLPNVTYTGSPYGVHFSKEQTQHGYIELLLDKGKYTFRHIDLELPTLIIKEIDAKDINTINPMDNLIRVKVRGSSEELEALPSIKNVQYITSLVLREQETQVIHKTDILETLISIVGDDTHSRGLLTRIHKEIT